MPAVRLTVFKYYTLITSSIIFNSEIISPCSYCVKKGLVYVIIADLSSCQPFSCLEYTKLNIYALYNMRLVSFNKYIFLTHLNSLWSLLLP